MKIYASLGLAAGVLVVVSAGAHAFVGWPGLRAALAAEGAGRDILNAAQAGWHWGSFCMLAFGTIVIAESVAAFRQKRPHRVVVSAIALAYLVFGVWAYVRFDFNPHFLLFIATGLLVSSLLMIRPPASD